MDKLSSCLIRGAKYYVWLRQMRVQAKMSRLGGSKQLPRFISSLADCGSPVQLPCGSSEGRVASDTTPAEHSTLSQPTAEIMIASDDFYQANQHFLKKIAQILPFTAMCSSVFCANRQSTFQVVVFCIFCFFLPPPQL